MHRVEIPPGGAFRLEAAVLIRCSTGLFPWHPPKSRDFLSEAAVRPSGPAPFGESPWKRKEKLPRFPRAARMLIAVDFTECEIRKN